jgi:hypothetical protein
LSALGQRAWPRRLTEILAILAIVVFLWDTPALGPLRLMVVFFHELSHGLAAMLTGGSIEGIQLAKDGSGLCLTRGGSRFLVLNAGYLGSLLWGGLILVLAARSHRDRLFVAGAGGLLLAVTLLFIRPVQGFGFLSAAACGAALLALARWLPAAASDFILKLIGVSSCFYVVSDLKAIIQNRLGAQSDPHMLAELTGLPVLIWGLLWLLLAAAALLGFLVLAAGGPAQEPKHAESESRMGTPRS